ncbi:DPP IV N-terminal domain-containing protein [Hyphomonas sp.]|uniref:S9 family peptidase n=1 Tax=Hyphomonas sp. TaxID=87 RepID=UPI00391BD225
MTEPLRLTPERLYASPALSGPAQRAVKFSPDGRRVTFLKPRADDLSRFDLWQFDVATGAETMLADSALLDPADAELSEEEKALRERRRIAGVRGIADYSWGTADKILVPAGGDLFLITLKDAGPDVRRLTETDSFEYDAKVSPRGRYVSFIRNEALFVIDLASGEETQVSPDARPEAAVRYGLAEFVAQEEMDRYTGYWWSPDERYIAYTEVDESGVDIIPRFDIAADAVTVIEQRYPRAGQPNAKVALHVKDFETGRTDRIFSVGPDDYLARVNWTRESLWIQTVNRAQTEIRFNRTDGLPWRIWSPFREEQSRWVNLTNDFLALPDGSLLTTHETTGYRHIYRRNPATSDLQQITFGDWVVSELLGFDAASGMIYFTGFMDSPLERHLYAVPVGWSDAQVAARRAARLPNSACIDLNPGSNLLTKECPEVRRITPEGGSWSVALGPGAQSYVGTFSSPTQPPQTALYRIDGTRIAWISENALDDSHPYAPYLASHTVPEFGTLRAEDGQMLHYSIQLPPDFDPAKRYPVIVEVYGGPHVQRVSRDWRPLGDQFYTHQGYIVFRLDNRGTWNRGKRFEDVIHRRTGGPEVADQLKGVEWLKSQPFVDPDRIAIQGWSYGGYMALMVYAQAPAGTFAAAVSGAPVTDWALYDTFYTERYMGTPQDNAEGYHLSSVFAHLDGLTGPLLLIHGMADDNVTFDNTTRLMAALQARSQPFELMTYPGQRHGIQGEALQLHLMRTRMAFLDRHLKGTAP